MDIRQTAEPRADVYRTITDTIIAAIERGADEFVMPWHGSGIARPQNALTGNDYHGVNILALWAVAHTRSFATGWWGTYRQWQLAGGQVRKGEQAATIVFFKRLEADAGAEDTGKGENGNGPSQATRLFARASPVFNADQVDGWAPPAAVYPHGSAEAVAAVGALVEASKARIEHDRPMACYRIDRDLIEMPPMAAFRGSPSSTPTQAYAATLLHELVHNAAIRIMPHGLRWRLVFRASAMRLFGIIRALPGTRGADRRAGTGSTGWLGRRRERAPSPSSACRRGCRSGLSRRSRDQARARSPLDRRRDGAGPSLCCGEAYAA